MRTPCQDEDKSSRLPRSKVRLGQKVKISGECEKQQEKRQIVTGLVGKRDPTAPLEALGFTWRDVRDYAGGDTDWVRWQKDWKLKRTGSC